MKNANIKILALFVSITIILASCGIGGMIKKYNTVTYETSPKVLELRGDSVAFSVKGTFPPKYFHKKAVIDFVPVLTYKNGPTTMKPVVIEGELVKAGNTNVIAKSTGGSFTYSHNFAYTPDMNVSELEVNALVAKINKKGTRIKVTELGKRKLADGVIYTSRRIMHDENVMLADNGYEKETILSKTASIYFVVNMSNLNMSFALNKNTKAIADLKALVDFTKQGWKIKNVLVNAWASPEGEENLNQGLSEKRSETGTQYMYSLFTKLAKEKGSKMIVKDPKKDITFNINAKGEDWEGFMKSIQASNIPEKNTIVNVVNSQADHDKRQQEIRNMTVIYKEIADVILPPLRRAEITVYSYMPKRTDQQIAILSTTYPDSLDNKELLYAATLTKDMNTQLKIYKSATTIYPTDWRGYNNAAYICIKQNKLDEAISYLEKANTISPNNGVILNNLGVATSQKGNYKTAMSYYESAKELKVDVNYNMGIIKLVKGDYDGAKAAFGNKTCDHNVGLVQLLTGKYDDAAKNLSCSPEDANTYYLLAIVAARTNNAGNVIENLKKAFAKDATLKAQAKEDREFLALLENPDFQNIVK